MQVIKDFKNPSGIVTRETQRSEIITINFTNEGIDGVADHLEELDAIRNSQEQDTILLYFSGCPGGNVDTGLAIINAISQTQARVVAIMEGHNASLATMIPMVCDEVVVTPYTSMMLHTAQTGGGYGTVHNVAKCTAHGALLIAKFLRDIYEGFATEEEIVKMIDGVELYLTDDEIKERLEARVEHMKQKEAAQVA